MAGEEIVTNPTFTGTIEPADSEKTSEVVDTGEPSSTPSFTQTPENYSTTVDTATSSATSKPVKPSGKLTPGIPSLTPTLPNPSSSPNQPSATNTPKPPAATYTSIPPTKTSEPPPTQTPDGCSFSGNASYENQVVDLINQERTDRGLPALVNYSSLRLAARRHSQDMACNDIFSHTGSDGSTLSTRLIGAGYSYSWAAENIAANSSSSFSAQAVRSGTRMLQ